MGLRASRPRRACASAAGAGDVQRPDVIIADYHLDEGDGLAAIAALRERFGADIPAILATADRSAEVREAALRAQIAILYKPAEAGAIARRC